MSNPVFTSYCPNNQGGSGQHEPITHDTATLLLCQRLSADSEMTAVEVDQPTQLAMCVHCGAVYVQQLEVHEEE